MLTTAPDYLISDCGCPQWHRAKSLSPISELYGDRELQPFSRHKLLPLRETLAEYYVRLLNELIAEANNAPVQPTKQQKHASNVLIKRQQRYAKQSSDSSATRRATPPSQSDLDVF